MGVREGSVDRARRLAAEDARRVRTDIALARRASRLSQAEVGRRCGIGASAVSRFEAGRTEVVDARLVACLGAVVGLDVRLKAYPAGDPIRDAGQARLLERLRRELHSSLHWRTEVPLPIEGDLRAWDAVIQGAGWRLAVEAETVLADIQALERRLALKVRDGSVDHVLLLAADTPRNRRARAAAGAAFAGLTGSPRDVLAALRNGRDPNASALLLR